MSRINIRKILNFLKPHLIAIGVFLILTAIYFSPIVFMGLGLEQEDAKSFQGWNKEIIDYREESQKDSHWTNSMFGGMPSNVIDIDGGFNIFASIASFFRLNMSIFHLGTFFMYLIGFYIFLCVLGCKSWLSILGSIAYAFASYNIIIIEVGHINKALSMATIAPIIAGAVLCYQRKYLVGSLITMVSVGINIAYNHQQISYYTILVLLIIALVYFVYAIKNKTLRGFLKASSVLLIVGFLAFLPSIGRYLPIYDYSKASIRGETVLKTDKGNSEKLDGLDIGYAFQSSLKPMESLCLLIPNMYGGSSSYELDERSSMAKVSRERGQNFYKSAPTYWGGEPITSGSSYAGAIVCFLFILGIFIVNQPIKWILLLATILSFMLSLGSNLSWFNEFLFQYLPLYNKFRVPAMSLIIAGVSIPALAVLALKELISVGDNSEIPNKDKYWKDVIYAAFLTGGICLFMLLFGKLSFSFISHLDANYPQWLQYALQNDRRAMLQSDSLRSFAFIVAATIILYLFVKRNMRVSYMLLSLAVLILIDLWVVDKRFLNEDDFMPKNKANRILATDANLQIMQDKDLSYRVFNVAANAFSESNTSYFHKSVGGYNPAKLRRYQDIIDYHLTKKMNVKVLNMLNARYFIAPAQDVPSVVVQRNVSALGNAWFVDSLHVVSTPNEEIEALYDFEPKTTAIVDSIWLKYVGDFPTLLDNKDTSAKIELIEYKPDYLKYKTSNKNSQMAVFSEIFYKTWTAYIDGKEVPHYRVNYILKGMLIPEGDHIIEFRCRDSLIDISSKIATISSIFISVFLLGLLLLILRKYKNDKRLIKVGSKDGGEANGNY